jgi:hypothetical protein
MMKSDNLYKSMEAARSVAGGRVDALYRDIDLGNVAPDVALERLIGLGVLVGDARAIVEEASGVLV